MNLKPSVAELQKEHIVMELESNRPDASERLRILSFPMQAEPAATPDGSSRVQSLRPLAARKTLLILGVSLAKRSQAEADNMAIAHCLKAGGVDPKVKWRWHG